MSLDGFLKGLGLARREPHATASFSQEGEDMILRRTFQGRKKGFYVDVGAHAPRRFSNTYLFYRKGWRGLNVDAMPGSMEAFERERPRDLNVEAAIATEEGELTYFMFNEPALNTLDEAVARERAVGEYRIVERRRVRTRPLRDVLREHLPPGQAIDFLSIDVEGLDLEVARSNDWGAYRPEVVLAETSALTLAEDLASELCRFLQGVGYEPYARTVKTLLLRRR